MIYGDSSTYVFFQNGTGIEIIVYQILMNAFINILNAIILKKFQEI